MYRQFAFEGDVHALLDCVPLTVRRKLDLVGLKISLAGWQALTRAERLGLCHLPADTAADLTIYREVMNGFAERAGVPLTPLADPDAASRAWNAATVPARVGDRLREIACRLDDARWRALDEESRYALLKLSDPKRDVAKLRAAATELGLL
jgi:hypothetical protein